MHINNFRDERTLIRRFEFRIPMGVLLQAIGENGLCHQGRESNAKGVDHHVKGQGERKAIGKTL